MREGSNGTMGEGSSGETREVRNMTMGREIKTRIIYQVGIVLVGGHG